MIKKIICNHLMMSSEQTIVMWNDLCPTWYQRTHKVTPICKIAYFFHTSSDLGGIWTKCTSPHIGSIMSITSSFIVMN